MKLSISTNITNPILRGDNYLEAIKNYSELADEVVVVDGDSTDGSLKEIEKLGLSNVRVVYYKWKLNWKWEQIPKSFNFGMEQCTGDWVIKMDIDRFFMEKDFAEIRQKLEENNDKPVASFVCYNFPLYNRYFCKSWRACAINKKFKDQFKLGNATNQFLSLSHPVEVKNKIGDIYQGVYDESKHIKIGVPMFNFDGTFKTKEHIKYFWYRYWKAYRDYYKIKMPFKEGNEINHYIEYHKPEIERSQEYEGKYPEIIKPLIDNIKPNQFGFNGWEKQ